MNTAATRSPGPASPGARLAAATRLGPVHLTITDLDRSVAYYQDAIGLQLHRREDPVAAMGAGGEDLVVLHERPDARPAGRHAGLYHFALLFPDRAELARAAVRLAAAQVPIDGASDHGTHEALYLSDPDGNGIELAADRPREQWPDPSSPSGYASGPAPLDMSGLGSLVAGEQPSRQAAAGLRIGHVHLHVPDLDAATRFYRDGLGFEVTAHLPSAVFVAAGGYHHHIGFNVWRGSGVPPAPADAVGLRHWTLMVADTGELAALRTRLTEIGAPGQDRSDGLLARDPSGTAALVVAQR